jgi:hypothetical protein
MAAIRKPRTATMYLNASIRVLVPAGSDYRRVLLRSAWRN